MCLGDILNVFEYKMHLCVILLNVGVTVLGSPFKCNAELCNSQRVIHTLVFSLVRTCSFVLVSELSWNITVI